VILYTVCSVFAGKAFLESMILGFLISIFNFVGLVRQVKKSFSGKIVSGIAGNSFLDLG